MLDGIKGIKMSGLTPKLSELIQQLRIRELGDMKSFRMVLIYCSVLAFVPQQISPIVTFGAFVGLEPSNGRVLDTTRLFTSISLLALLNQPLSQIFASIPSFMSSVGCLERIQKYLSADARVDYRLLTPALSAALAAEGIQSSNAVKEIQARVEILDDIELKSIKRNSRKQIRPLHVGHY